MRTGRRIEKGEHQPKRGKPRDWRTRKDPLVDVWESELVPMLERQPQLQPMTLFDYLQEKYPGRYDRSKLRTLQKRVQQLNRQCQAQFEAERQHLQPLPMHTCADYEVLSVRVTCHSTITVRCVLYTVPSQLIGQRLTIHLYHDCLVGFVGHQEVVQLPRVYAQTNTSKRRARSVRE